MWQGDGETSLYVVRKEVEGGRRGEIHGLYCRVSQGGEIQKQNSEYERGCQEAVARTVETL